MGGGGGGGSNNKQQSIPVDQETGMVEKSTGSTFTSLENNRKHQRFICRVNVFHLNVQATFSMR